MKLSTISRAIISVAIFISVTLLLWTLQENGVIPQIIFLIGFGLTIMVTIAIWIFPGWEDIPVIPIRRKR